MVKSGPFRPQEVRNIKGSGHGIHWRAFFFLFSFLKKIFLLLKKKKHCEMYTTTFTILTIYGSRADHHIHRRLHREV